MLEERGDCYEERHRFTPRAGVLLLFGLVSVVLSLLFGGPLFFKVIVWIVMGSMAVLQVVPALSRHLAFRVDAEGVTLGDWLGRRSGTEFVPWHDVAALVLWRERPNKTPYVGVVRREEVADTGTASRHISGWRLDHERLAMTLRRVAPHVRLEDLG